MYTNNKGINLQLIGKFNSEDRNEKLKIKNSNIVMRLYAEVISEKEKYIEQACKERGLNPVKFALKVLKKFIVQLDDKAEKNSVMRTMILNIIRNELK